MSCHKTTTITTTTTNPSGSNVARLKGVYRHVTRPKLLSCESKEKDQQRLTILPPNGERGQGSSVWEVSGKRSLWWIQASNNTEKGWLETSVAVVSVKVMGERADGQRHALPPANRRICRRGEGGGHRIPALP